MADSEKDVLLKISQATSSISNLDQLLKTSLRIAAQAMGVDRCSIWLTDDEKKFAIVKAVYIQGRSRPVHLDLKIDLNRFPKFKRIITQKRIIHSPDISKVKANKSERELFAKAKIKSSLSVPLKIRNKVLGALNFGTIKHYKSFTSSEKSLALIIANQIAVGIEHARLYKELSDRAAWLQEQSIKVLRESEEKYRTLLENLPQMIFLKDKNSVYVSANRNFCSALGIEPEEFRGKTDFDYFPKELAQKYRRDDRDIIRTGKTKEIVEDYVEKGKRKVVRTVKTPVLGDDGKPIGVLGIFWDITEQKKSEQIQSVLYKIAESVHRVRDLQELYKTIHNVLGTVLDTTNLYIALYDKNTDTISLPYYVDQKDKFTSFPAGKTLTAYVIKHDKPLLVTREVRKKLIESGKVKTIGVRSKIWLGVPLKIGEEVIGVVTVQSYTNPSAYGERELEILKYASTQIASAIQQKQAEDKLIRSEQITRERARLLSDLRGLDKFDDILTRVCRSVRDSGLFQRAVMTINKPGGEIVNLGQVGLPAAVVQRARKAPPLGPKLRARITNKRFRISDSFFVPVEAGVDFGKTGRYIPQKRKETIYGNWQKEDELFVPLRDFSGKVMGYLSADTPVDGFRPDRKTIEALEMLVEAAASRIREVEAQNAIKKERDFSKSVIETANSLIICLDHDARITAFNKECERITGYQRQEVLGKKWPEMFLPPEYRHKKLKSFASWVQAHPRDQYEGPIKTKKGEIRTILWSNTAILGSREKDLIAIAIGQDINERKKTEEALQLSQERYKLSTKAAKVGVWDWDLKSNRFYIDPNIKEILGYKDKEIPNDIDVWTTYVHPDDLKPVMASAQACIEGKTPEYIVEHRMMHKDGSVRWVLSNGKVIRDKDGNAVRMIGTDTDVTKRKLAEEAFIESEQRFRMMAEASPDYIFQTDKYGKTIYCSPAIERILGYTPGERLGRKFSTIISPSELSRAKTLFKKVFAGEIIQNLEINLLHKSGRTVPIEVSVVPISENGEVSSLFGIARDITERKKTDEALRQSEETARAILNASFEVVLLVNPDGIIVAMNDALSKVFGKKQDELVGKCAFDFMSPDVAQHRKIQMNKAIRSGQPIRFEDQRKGRWLDNNIYPILDAKGKVAKLAVFAHDITAHKKAEEVIRENEKQLRLLTDSLPVLISYVDSDQRYRFNNKGYEDWFGYSPEEARGKHIKEVLGKSAYQKIRGYVKKALSGQKVTFESTVPYKDGGTRYVYASYIPDFGEKGKVKGFYALISDITERKKADDALKESEEKIKNIFSSIGDAVTVTDLKGNIIECNQATLDLHGFSSKKEIFGRSSLDFIAPKDHSRAKRNLRKTLEQSFVKDEEYTLLTVDKREFPGELSASVVRSASGEPVAFVAITKDISERKEAEKILRKSRDLNTILQINYKISQIHDLDKMLHLTCEETAKALGVERCSISLMDEEGKGGEVKAAYMKNQPRPEIIGSRFLLKDFPRLLRLYQRKEKFVYAPIVEKAPLSQRERDYFRAEGVKSFVIVPITTGKRLFGAIMVGAMGRERVFAESETAFIQTLASHLAVALQNIKLMDVVREQAGNLRTLAQRVVSAQEEERKRIAQELHDEISQDLAYMKINTEITRKNVPAEFDQVIQRIKDNENLIIQTLNKVRDLTSNLRPPLLDDLGLVETLRWYIKEFSRRTDIKVTLISDRYRRRLTQDLEMVLYRISQEALANVAKHAQATQVSILLEKKNNFAVLTVKDDGIGFDLKKVQREQKMKKGFGLFSMEERVKLLNGSFKLTSKLKKGTSLEIN
ncbi:MAG: PAS domain S-box protein, partial [Candidatus Zixiibacteriota bacterium]